MSKVEEIVLLKEKIRELEELVASLQRQINELQYAVTLLNLGLQSAVRSVITPMGVRNRDPAIV